MFSEVYFDTIMILIVVISMSYHDNKAARKRNELTHKKLDFMMSQLNVTYPPQSAITSKIQRAIQTGDRNKAYEMLMADTGCNEKQAIAAIEIAEKGYIEELSQLKYPAADND